MTISYVPILSKTNVKNSKNISYYFIYNITYGPFETYLEAQNSLFNIYNKT